MEVLFLGGVFDDSHIPEIASNTVKYIEFPANSFQKKILCGLEECSVHPTVVSAPFLGAYPFAYREVFFRGFDKNTVDNSGYTYVRFNNIWGLRNPSRARALKKAVKSFAEKDGDQKLIIVYTPHTPLIQAANYAKRIDGSIRICLVIPDLPQYMDLSEKTSPIYSFFKKYDVKRFLTESKNADSFVILTEQMAQPLRIGSRPYEVIEGIYEPVHVEKTRRNDGAVTIAYTGKLNRSFGVIDLLEAFSAIDDDSLRLVICGSGEDKDAVRAYAAKDSRIDFRGQVSAEEAAVAAANADILVNPRKNDMEYTKFSFPSKIIDYLATGNPVVAYRLDGMPEVYESFLHIVPDNGADSLKETILRVLQLPDEEKRKKSEAALSYLENKLSCRRAAERIIDLNFPKKR